MTWPFSLTAEYSIAVLQRRSGRLLDPRRHPSHGPWGVRGATAYHSGGLIVGARDADLQTRVRRALTEIAVGRGSQCRFSDTGVEFLPRDSSPAADPHTATEPAAASDDWTTPDPWSVLAAVRRSGDPDVIAAVGLNHLMSMAEQPGGNPFALGHGTPGLDRYGVVGYPGRGPVGFAVAAPRAALSAPRPRVLVLDTGVGPHPWFADDPVRSTVTISDTEVLGADFDPDSIRASGADGAGLIGQVMLGSLGTHAGHGTFISGLLRQECPQAEIMSLAIMGSDGVAQEQTLISTLTKVLGRVQAEPWWLDAVVLSLGYYAETAEDRSYTAHLKDTLVAYGRAGVAVFCAAGNDATTRPSYPAAFAVDPVFDEPDVVPLVSVAALNPNGTLAAFSNRGPWVTGAAPGVGMISTAPVYSDGSDRAEIRVPGRDGRVRSGLDPDDFRSGFASWSGTSFAAPVLAGGYLRRLSEDHLPRRIARRRQLMPPARRATSTQATEQVSSAGEPDS